MWWLLGTHAVQTHIFTIHLMFNLLFAWLQSGVSQDSTLICHRMASSLHCGALPKSAINSSHISSSGLYLLPLCRCWPEHQSTCVSEGDCLQWLSSEAGRWANCMDGSLACAHLIVHLVQNVWWLLKVYMGTAEHWQSQSDSLGGN